MKTRHAVRPRIITIRRNQPVRPTGNWQLTTGLCALIFTSSSLAWCRAARWRNRCAKPARLNGAAAKSAREVRVGDEIAIRQRGRITTVRVVQVPVKPPPKAQAASLYETVGIESYESDPYA